MKEDWISSLYIKEQIKKKMNNIEILVFTKDGCPPCKVVKPILEEYDNATFLDAMEYAKDYNLRQAPTILFLKDGEEAARLIGIQTKDSIDKVLSTI